MNFHLRPYNQYILNIVTNIYLGLDFIEKIPEHQSIMAMIFIGVGIFLIIIMVLIVYFIL